MARNPNAAPAQAQPEREQQPQQYGFDHALAGVIADDHNGQSFASFRNDITNATAFRYTGTPKERRKQAGERFDGILRPLHAAGTDLFKAAYDINPELKDDIAHLGGDTDRIITAFDTELPGTEEFIGVTQRCLEDVEDPLPEEDEFLDAMQWRWKAEVLSQDADQGPVRKSDFDDWGPRAYRNGQQAAINELIQKAQFKLNHYQQANNPAKADKYQQEIDDLREYLGVFVNGTRARSNDHGAAKEYIQAFDPVAGTNPTPAQTLAMENQRTQDRVFVQYDAKIKLKMREMLDQLESGGVAYLTNQLQGLKNDLGGNYASEQKGAGFAGMKWLQGLGLNGSDIDRLAYDGTAHDLALLEARLAQRQARDNGQQFSMDGFIQQRVSGLEDDVNTSMKESYKRGFKHKATMFIGGRDVDGNKLKGFKRVASRLLTIGGGVIAATNPLFVPVFAGAKFYMWREGKARVNYLNETGANKAKSEATMQAIMQATSTSQKVRAALAVEKRTKDTYTDKLRADRTKRILGSVGVAAGTYGAISYGLPAAHWASDHVISWGQSTWHDWAQAWNGEAWYQGPAPTDSYLESIKHR